MTKVLRKYLTFPNLALGLGLLFLYVPIFSMIVYSFNNSRLVTVWDAANSPTVRWYFELFNDRPVLQAACAGGHGAAGAGLPG